MPAVRWMGFSAARAASNARSIASIPGAAITAVIDDFVGRCAGDSRINGKFARIALQTANIDYNGRLCMVSAGAANRMAFGVDRAANPWDDILEAEVVLIAGSNTAECSPITTNYVWQARENGAKLIVLDPRMTPIARTADRAS